jgi:hypothetical protein
MLLVPAVQIQKEFGGVYPSQRSSNDIGKPVRVMTAGTQLPGPAGTKFGQYPEASLQAALYSTGGTQASSRRNASRAHSDE